MGTHNESIKHATKQTKNMTSLSLYANAAGASAPYGSVVMEGCSVVASGMSTTSFVGGIMSHLALLGMGTLSRSREFYDMETPYNHGATWGSLRVCINPRWEAHRGQLCPQHERVIQGRQWIAQYEPIIAEGGASADYVVFNQYLWVTQTPVQATKEGGAWHNTTAPGECLWGKL